VAVGSKGGIVTGWRCDGQQLTEDELGALGQCDGEALCDYAGVAFRFRAETVVPRTADRSLPGESTTVMTLRRLGGAGLGPGVCLIDFSRPTRFVSAERDWRLDDAAGKAASAARRHVAGELFHRAEEAIGDCELG